MSSKGPQNSASLLHRLDLTNERSALALDSNILHVIGGLIQVGRAGVIPTTYANTLIVKRLQVLLRTMRNYSAKKRHPQGGDNGCESTNKPLVRGVSWLNS
jgi:hypothetical protein